MNFKINKYKISRANFVRILKRIHSFYSKPSPIKLLEIEKDIAKSIVKIEILIRKTERYINKIWFKIKANKGNKNIIIRNQKRLKIYQNYIYKYKYEIRAFRMLGDTIAWSFFEANTIRQHTKIKPHAGFLSDKVGFKKELTEAQRVVNLGGYPIISDITNCLKFGDITIFGLPGAPGTVILEVKKKARALQGRTLRQFERLNAFTKYLNTDQIKKDDLLKAFPGFYGKNAPEALNAISLNFEKKFNFKEYEANLTSVWKNKKSFIQVDNDTACHAFCYRREPDYLNNIIDEMRTKFIKNREVRLALGTMGARIDSRYYVEPFTSFLSPKLSAEVIYGNLDIITFIDLNSFEKECKKKGWILNYNTDRKRKDIGNLRISLSSKGKEQFGANINYILDFILYTSADYRTIFNYIEAGIKLYEEEAKKHQTK